MAQRTKPYAEGKSLAVTQPPGRCWRPDEGGRLSSNWTHLSVQAKSNSRCRHGRYTASAVPCPERELVCQGIVFSCAFDIYTSSLDVPGALHPHFWLGEADSRGGK